MSFSWPQILIWPLLPQVPKWMGKGQTGLHAHCRNKHTRKHAHLPAFLWKVGLMHFCVLGSRSCRQCSDLASIPFGFLSCENCVKKIVLSWVPVAHAYNPSYSGGRYQDDCGLKPARANSSWDPILKISFTKKGLVEWFKRKVLSSSKKRKRKRIVLKSFLYKKAYQIRYIYENLLLKMYLKLGSDVWLKW
jgi:hypothetical protein